MKKYVDTESIKKIILEEGLYCDTEEDKRYSASKIDGIPTDDVVEVVRCENCVWYDKRRPYANGNTLYRCINLEIFFPPDFFCKDGERREDEY